MLISPDSVLTLPTLYLSAAQTPHFHDRNYIRFNHRGARLGVSLVAQLRALSLIPELACRT
jgi:hypothetical protein